MGKYFTDENNKLKNLHEGHRKRLRSRLNNISWLNCEEHEIMEYLLTFPRTRGDTNAIAHRLINAFGSVANVIDAPVEKLIKIEGVGEVTATFLHNIPNLFLIYKNSKSKEKPILTTPQQVFDYFGKTFNHFPNEELHLLLLDINNKLINTKVIARGDANKVDFLPQEIPSQAVLVGAKRAIMIHNHPDKNPTPSDEDIQVTYQLYSSLAACGIDLVEHLIVCQDDESYYSFSTSGIMAQFYNIYKNNCTIKVNIDITPPKLD